MANQLEQAQARFERLKTNLDKFNTKNKALLDKYAKYAITTEEARWGNAREIIHKYGIADIIDDKLYNEVWKLMDVLDRKAHKEYELEEARKRLTMLKDKAAVKQSADATIDAEVAILDPMLEEFKKAYRTRRLEMAITSHHEKWTKMRPKWTKEQADIIARREELYKTGKIYHYNSPECKEYDKLFERLKELNKKMSCEELRYPELSEYLEVVEDHIEKCWNNSIRVLASKTLQQGGIAGYRVQHLSFNEARIEALFVNDNKETLYARLIWAAEYSCLVAPHERYIITKRG